MELELLHVHRGDDDVVRVVMDNPPHNLQSLEMVEEFRLLLNHLDEQTGIRALILRSAIPERFMPGADLKVSTICGTSTTSDRRSCVESSIAGNICPSRPSPRSADTRWVEARRLPWCAISE